MKKRSTLNKSRNLSKKQQTKKSAKHLSAHIESKSNNKKKVKSSNQQCKDFIISNGRVIMIKTRTDRDRIQDLIHTMKRENNVVSRQTQYESNHQKRVYKKNINDIQEIVRSLSKSQKLKTIKKLQSDLNIPPRSQPAKVDPLNKLDRKLQKVKIQLHFKWEAQQQKLTQMFQEGIISQKVRQQKSKMINRLKEHKIKIIDCTRNLFCSILRNQNEEQAQQEGVEDVLKSLNSFSSFDTFPDVQNANQMWQATSQMKVQESQMNQMVEAKITSPAKRQQILQAQDSLKVAHPIRSSSVECQTVSSELIRIEASPKKQKIETSAKKQKAVAQPRLEVNQEEFNLGFKIQLKQKCDLNEQSQTYNHKISLKGVVNQNKENLSVQNYSVKVQSQQIQNSYNIPNHQSSDAAEQLLLSPELQKQRIKQRQQRDKHIDDHDPDSGISISKLKIPTLMTRDKLQQLQMQKKAKQFELFKQNMQRRIAIQLSCVEEEGQNTFTTLADVNNYIVNLYQFITGNFCMQVVNSLNTPYGKSVLDKLFNLQNSGAESEDEYVNVFEEQFYGSHQKHMAMSLKKPSEYQKMHCKAVFDAFNSGLNAFRPYFQIEGQVYPWMVSQKGITFYQINQQNIQQVFEKTKIKVLEHCSCLCGLQTNESQFSYEQGQILKRKREQLEKKCFQTQIKEQFKTWDLKLMNYETMCRLIVAETVFNEELLNLVAQIVRFV